MHVPADGFAHRVVLRIECLQYHHRQCPDADQSERSPYPRRRRRFHRRHAVLLDAVPVIPNLRRRSGCPHRPDEGIRPYTERCPRPRRLHQPVYARHRPGRTGLGKLFTASLVTFDGSVRAEGMRRPGSGASDFPDASRVPGRGSSRAHYNAPERHTARRPASVREPCRGVPSGVSDGVKVKRSRVPVTSRSR